MALTNTPAPIAGFDEPEAGTPHIFLQWKGTNACMDVYCLCGEHLHFDGYFAYAIQCGGCKQIYELPFFLQMKPVETTDRIVQYLTPEED